MIIATESGLGFKHEIAHSSAGRQKETRYLTDLPRNFWITVTVMGSIPDCNSSILNTDLYMLWNSFIPHLSAHLWDYSFWDLAFIALGFVLHSFLVKLSALFLFKAVSKCCLCLPAPVSQMPVSIHQYFLCNIQTTGSDNQKSIPKLYLPPWFVESTTFFFLIPC